MNAKLARTLWNYSPESGELIWKIPNGRSAAGNVAGTLRASGHIQIGYKGKLYMAHRLAYLIVKGRWPREFLDHIDGNGANNQWTNLRDASHAENMRNIKTPVTNTSGHKGVSWDKTRNKWLVMIRTATGQKNGGRYDDLSDAIVARKRLEQTYHGDFANER